MKLEKLLTVKAELESLLAQTEDREERMHISVLIARNDKKIEKAQEPKQMEIAY